MKGYLLLLARQLFAPELGTEIVHQYYQNITVQDMREYVGTKTKS